MFPFEYHRLHSFFWHTPYFPHTLPHKHFLTHTHELHLPFAVIILAAIYLLSMFRLSTDCQTAHSPPPTATPPTRHSASFFLAHCYHFHFKMSLSWQRLLLLERSASFSQPHPQPHLRLRLWPLNASPTPCYSGPFCAGPKRRDVTTPLQPVRSPCPTPLLRSVPVCRVVLLQDISGALATL